MQITLPDDPRIAAKAAAAGFANIDEYVRHLVEQDEPPTDQKPQPHELPYEEWKERFDNFLAMQKPRNATLDDSREAIYGERLRKQMLIDDDAR